MLTGPACFRRYVVLAFLMALLTPGTAWAYYIESVALLPDIPLTPATPVSLETHITTPSGEPFLYQPTDLTIVGNQITVDIYIDSGPLAVVSHYTETTALGQFPVGEYQYTVNLFPANDIELGRDMRQVTGSFTVTPEPSSLALLGIGIAGVACRRIRSRRDER